MSSLLAIQFVYYFNKQPINSRITSSWIHSCQIDIASSHQILEKKSSKKSKFMEIVKRYRQKKMYTEKLNVKKEEEEEKVTSAKF